MQGSRFPFIVVALLALVLGIISANLDLLSGSDNGSNSSHPIKNSIVRLDTATVLSPAKLVPEFSLLDHKGQEFTKQTLQGKHSIVFFGFINCPDICPGTLQFLKSVKHKLTEAQQWDEFQVVFVSVDPARDTVANMADYMPYFDQEFIGVTGTTDSIDAFAKSVSMPYSLSEKDEHGHYNVDHSASMLLMNEEGNVKAIITQPQTLDALSSDLLTIVSN